MLKEIIKEMEGCQDANEISKDMDLQKTHNDANSQEPERLKNQIKFFNDELHEALLNILRKMLINDEFDFQQKMWPSLERAKLISFLSEFR